MEMKFKIGDTVKISKNNSLLFDATGKLAKVTDVISTTSSFSGKQVYCCYEIEVKVKGQRRSIVVEEQEIKRYKRA